MRSRPTYFDPVRASASKRWEQLESDPELAGPWHQLFKQVQSPRHVLSELLQNADDAGATEAWVAIEDDALVFGHNGHDFNEEQFASLCRFGYSNKRVLHTIGFRGIGFKSTFSVGPRVEIHTPTLAVAFHRHRFTEPVWAGDPRTDQTTVVRVPIADAHRRRELEKNLGEWAKSPVSLLFFRRIRRLRVQDKNLDWVELASGPIPNSAWMALASAPDDIHLLVRSEPEEFPEEALLEIRQERLLGADEGTDLPPCQVEIVLGASGRLYVVLPTGVETPLPFACNAPFIQDPARLKIKDPETSPTNRWLLERAGSLAAAALLDWLSKDELGPGERAKAYDLLPDVDRTATSLEGACAAVVEESVDESLGDQPFLLVEGDDRGLVEAERVVALPSRILDIWPAEVAAAVFDPESRPALSRDISPKNRQKLLNWGVITEVSKDHVISILQSRHLPKPATWKQLLALWTYVAPEITGYKLYGEEDTVRIVPVQGKDVLYSAKEVVRLGEKRLLNSDDDWLFVADHLLVLNQNWLRYLAEHRRDQKGQDDGRAKRAETALAVLRRIGLEGSSDVAKVVDRVAAAFFSAAGTKTVADSVRIAHIAARLGATAGDAFRFVTRDCRIRGPAGELLYDADGDLDLLLPAEWCSQHLLHEDYDKEFTSCTRDEWSRWAIERSGLAGFVGFRQSERRVWGRDAITRELVARGARQSPYFRYVTHSFVIQDWDFDRSFWQHWECLAADDPAVWVRIVEKLLPHGEKYWAGARTARVFQIATTGSRSSITSEPVVPQWILRLRELPCLRDSSNRPRKPGDLLRRTAATEPLLDVEPFVHRDLDTEANRSLLTLLGVRDNPTGPERILDYLRALATSGTPPAAEVEKWYRRLDQLHLNASTAVADGIRRAFERDRIILTEDGGWTTSRGVFQLADEDDVPGAAVVRMAVRDLSLWRRIGVADRPTADLAIEWLRDLETDVPLTPDDLRRVRAVLARHPVRVWTECDRWLNLSGELVAVDSLRFGLSMQSLVAWSHLHEWVKRQTADLQRLSAETVGVEPFSRLPPLSAELEQRFRHSPAASASPERKPWLGRLGAELRRIRLDDTGEADRVRRLALDLSVTTWQTASPLEVVPYLDDKPAGTAKRVEVIWADRVLYVETRPLAKLARSLAQELGRAFGRQDIADAIKMCFERTPEFVSDYMEENFDLRAQEEIELEGTANVQEAGAAANPEPDTTVRSAEVEVAETESTPPHMEPQQSQAQDLNEGIDEDEGDETASEPTGPSRPQTKRPPAKPSIVERFARAHGFRPDGEGRYYGDDGSWIARSLGTRFPWERRTSAGDLVRYYWPADHCLENEPLELDADVWDLVDRQPELYALILADTEDHPVEVSGYRVRELREARMLTLHPATYRLVYEHASKR